MPVAACPRLPPTMPAPGSPVRSARASVALALLALGTATACAPDGLDTATGPGGSPGFSIVPVTAGGGGMAKPSVLDFATYDGSREVVHPDVMRAPASLGG